jgi:hypothetical protein
MANIATTAISHGCEVAVLAPLVAAAELTCIVYQQLVTAGRRILVSARREPRKIARIARQAIAHVGASTTYSEAVRRERTTGSGH